MTGPCFMFHKWKRGGHSGFLPFDVCSKCGWRRVFMGYDYAYYPPLAPEKPSDDAPEVVNGHVLGDDCPCGPSFELVKGPDGSDAGYVITHRRMEGLDDGLD